MTTHTPGEVRLVDLAVGDITGDFFVPFYQRGYRWGRLEVEHLLDDISQSEGERYYLQPVVVKAAGEDRWELVDGQQRLTTLYLILRYINRHVLQADELRFRLDYETRPGSPAFLDDPNDEHAADNIDFFHINQSATTIRQWFERQPNRMQAGIDLYTAFSKRVRVIWYEAPATADSTTLFTRLNVGRIPLTDAELVKALILSRSRAADGTTDRSREIAAQWDLFERDLRAAEVWAFATGSADDPPTRIGLLLDSIAGTIPASPPFHTFDVLRKEIDAPGGADKVWKKIVDRHSLVIGWYEDRDLFHKVGFLIAAGVRFAELVAPADEQTKSDFDAGLDNRIRAQIKLSEEELNSLEYGTQANNAKAELVLLLMNVETVRRNTSSSERFSFSRYASGAWSLEHIHAQSSGRMTAEQQRAWLALHRDALRSLPDLDDDVRADLVARIDAASADISQEVFAPLQRKVLEHFSESAEEDADTMHSLRNLALLLRDDNSALNDGAFEVKRIEIIKRDQNGSYIPVCTRNVFLKYYTQVEGQQLHFWGLKDREAYFVAMLDQVRPYLDPDEKEDT